LIRSPSILEEIAFVTLDAGQTHDVTVNLNNYTSDPDFITGWQLTQPDEYDLLVSCQFDREVAKEKYGQGCVNIDGTDKPWNQAVELKRTEELRLVVQ
jgi:hypothetical protein